MGTPDTLILKGGGVKGLAFAGAIGALPEHRRFTTYVGTSAGAIAAVLLAAGYEPSELEGLLRSLDFRTFLDPWWRRPWNLLTCRGLNRGHRLQTWVRERIYDKHPTRRTLGLPLKMRELDKRAVVYAASSTGTVPFDSQGENADVDADFAVRCSASIPFFFAPEKHNGEYIFDGGLLNNYPVETFLDANPRADFLAIYLSTGQARPSSPAPGVLGVLLAVLDIVINRDERATVLKHADRTIIVDPSPVQTTDFDLSDSAKEFLAWQGRAAALRHATQQTAEPARRAFEALDRAATARQNVFRERDEGRAASPYWLLLIPIAVVLTTALRWTMSTHGVLDWLHAFTLGATLLGLPVMVWRTTRSIGWLLTSLLGVLFLAPFFALLSQKPLALESGLAPRSDAVAKLAAGTSVIRDTEANQITMLGDAEVGTDAQGQPHVLLTFRWRKGDRLLSWLSWPRSYEGRAYLKGNAFRLYDYSLAPTQHYAYVFGAVEPAFLMREEGFFSEWLQARLGGHQRAAAPVPATLDSPPVTSPEHISGGLDAPEREHVSRATDRLSAALRSHVRPPKFAGHAWTTAQVLLALEGRMDLSAQELESYAFQQSGPGTPGWRKWRELQYPPNLAASAWMAMALARARVALRPDQLRFFLENQGDAGWWPIFGDRTNPVTDDRHASTYATAMCVLALQEQLRRGLVDDEKAAGRAVDAGVGWLLAKQRTTAARWPAYPGGEDSVGVSGLVLHVLHRRGSPEAVHLGRLWLDDLPAVSSSAATFEVWAKTINGHNGKPIHTDDTRYYTLPWTVIATADAYTHGSAVQRSSALAWIREVVRHAPTLWKLRGDLDDAWISAEMLLALRTLSGNNPI